MHTLREGIAYALILVRFLGRMRFAGVVPLSWYASSGECDSPGSYRYLGTLPRANAIRRGRTAILVRFPSVAKRPEL